MLSATVAICLIRTTVPHISNMRAPFMHVKTLISAEFSWLNLSLTQDKLQFIAQELQAIYPLIRVDMGNSTSATIYTSDHIAASIISP